MQSSLKLTITAVGEPDSVFLTPCKPITLHESSVEVQDEDDLSADDEEAFDAAAALAELRGAEVLILSEETKTSQVFRRSA